MRRLCVVIRRGILIFVEVDGKRGFTFRRWLVFFNYLKGRCACWRLLFGRAVRRLIFVAGVALVGRALAKYVVVAFAICFAAGVGVV